MMLPSIFGENLLDDLMDDFAFPRVPDVDRVLYGKHAKNLMKTDVRELDDTYEVDIDLPGFKKDEIKMELEKGCLTISASKEYDSDEKQTKGKYVRRERYMGAMSRSYYLGEHITEEDIHPKFENGILSFTIPKEDKKPIENKKHFIEIEG